MLISSVSYRKRMNIFLRLFFELFNVLNPNEFFLIIGVPFLSIIMSLPNLQLWEFPNFFYRLFAWIFYYVK